MFILHALFGDTNDKLYNFRSEEINNVYACMIIKRRVSQNWVTELGHLLKRFASFGDFDGIAKKNSRRSPHTVLLRVAYGAVQRSAIVRRDI